MKIGAGWCGLLQESAARCKYEQDGESWCTMVQIDAVGCRMVQVRLVGGG